MARPLKESAGRQYLKLILTAMVDLAFLLITFFMLTTSLSKKNAMDVVKPIPIDEAINVADWPASRTVTILLGKNNKTAYYLGEPSSAIMQTVDLNAVGKIIRSYKTQIADVHQLAKDKRMLVIIKPTNTSIYENFVDILDEMNINKVVTYAIDDKYVLPSEIAFMKAKGI